MPRSVASLKPDLLFVVAPSAAEGFRPQRLLSALPKWLFGHMSLHMPLACCETKARSSPIVVDCAAEEL